MANTNANTLNNIASQLEVVMPFVTEINAAENDQLYGRVKKTAKVEKISRYLLRWPAETQIGGNFQKIDDNAGGVLPKGTQIVQIKLLAGYFTSAIGFVLADEQTKLVDSQQAVVDIASRQMAMAMVAQMSYDDVTFHQDGTGILTNSSSLAVGGTNATMTFAAATDGLGINQLFEGMCVSVWDSTGATERVAATAAPIVINSINYDTKTVTFNQDVTALTTGDIIALRAMTTYGPSTLTSFNSTYPGTVGAAAGGIGGDSFRHGFPYWTNPTTSNYFYSQLKSTYPQLNAVRVNAASDTLQWEQGLRIVAKIKQKRPQKEMWKDIEGIAHGTQKSAAFELGMSISQKLIGGNEFGQSLDLVPTNQANSDTFNFAGIKCNESTRQDRTRIDFINFSKIGRAEAAEEGPYSVGGKQFFEGRDSSTGQPMTYFEWYYMGYFENVAWDAGAFARLDNLAAPSAQWDA